MGKFALLVAALGLGFLMANQGTPVLHGLEDNLVYVALLPGAYILGLALLRD